MEGSFYPAESSRTACSRTTRNAADGGNQQQFLSDAKVTALENWANSTPEHFRFSIKAPRRITHEARIKADTAADSVAFLYRNLETSAPTRAGVVPAAAF